MLLAFLLFCKFSMSPTPPETEQEDDNSEYCQPDKPLNRMQDIQCNSNSTEIVKDGEVKSAYFHGLAEPEKPKRGRQSKVATKPQPVRNGAIKKRGRPPKVKTDDVPSKQSKITDTLKKTKRTINRFKGVTKEELMERLLPDRIKHGLDILIIGINPGLFAAYKGHHYAGPGNHFWSCINMSGFVDRKMTSDNDIDLLDYGIGFSTIVQRTTPGAKDLTTTEIKEGAKKLIEKIQFYQPKIAVFNGKGIYEIFSKEVFGQKKKDFTFGTQQNKMPNTNTYIFVMPSSSARCAQFPRAQDKVHFYIKLKDLRDEIKGTQSDANIREVGYSFDLHKATELAKVQNIKQEKFDPDFEARDSLKNGGPVAYPVFNSANGPTTSNSTETLNGVLGAQDWKIITVGADGGKPESSSSLPKASTAAAPQRKSETENISSRHSHLVRYLQQELNDSDPESKSKSVVVMPTTFSTGNPKLQEDVSEEQKQERVGNWVRQQQSLEYDSDPPMGMERQEEVQPSAPDRTVSQGVEMDGASQLSAISAGVSGSASESTSGYGSIDASSRRVRLDRVEMWVMEQQHVRRHTSTTPSQLQQHQQVLQSLQAANSHHQALASSQNRLSPNPVNGWQQGSSQTMANYTVPVPTVAQTLASQVLSNVARNVQRTTSTISNHVNNLTDQLPGSYGLPTTSDRVSPYSFLRGQQREIGSASGASIRPPVPLYSSWGGEESSGGSGMSSQAIGFHNNTTQSSPTQPFVIANTSTSVAPTSSANDNVNSVLPMSWQASPGNATMMTPHYKP